MQDSHFHLRTFLATPNAGNAICGRTIQSTALGQLGKPRKLGYLSPRATMARILYALARPKSEESFHWRPKDGGSLIREDDASLLVLPVSARDHVQGSLQASVTLLEYGDFECEHCLRAFPVVKEVRRWLRGELLYVFRHFPIVSEHPRAREAAEAAEAAGAQDKFWEMHDLLWERNSALSAIYLEGCAQAVGLDRERFEREVREHNYIDKVRDDFESGVASGVAETPAFFINGVLYRGPTDLDSLLAAIEEAGTAP